MSNCHFNLMGRLFVAIITAIPCLLQAQTPEWIWRSATPANGEMVYFRKTFTAQKKYDRAVLAVAADDEADVWLNGKMLSSVKGWNSGAFSDIARRIKPGENVIAVRGKNDGGDAAVMVRVELVNQRGTNFIVTDKSWLASTVAEAGWETTEFKAGKNWVPAVSRGPNGMAPWGEVLKKKQATAAEDLAVAPGFKAELLYSVSAEGTWIAMGIDDKGRLIVSPQGNDLPLYRITLNRSHQVEKIEPIKVSLRNAMGFLWAYDSLYVNSLGPKGPGLYRLIDKNKNDEFEEEEVHFLKRHSGEGEHGFHGLALGPDGKIYVMNGNHVKVTEGILPTSPHKNYAEDFLLPRQWDAGGHAVGILAPGGYVVRTDAEGKDWELVLAGYRNAYDLDFNADGELFTFDSDMEWEWGMWWYKPTRILHSVSAAEFGWRSGSGKWPAYYPDSLPAASDIAIGSPTGTKFGTKSNYPERYKRAFYAMDWSYGRIFAVHLKPDGASYTATYENFIKGRPLNVTDLEFGKDGAMYFITGGRGTQSGLYRVSYVGGEVKEPKPTELDVINTKAAVHARNLRHILESFHGHQVAGAVDVAWPHMGDKDRFIRYAARIAVESQNLAEWKDRAINESQPEAGLNALLALARCGGRETQKDLLMALKKFPLNSLSEEQKLTKLRVIQLSFIRQGKPEAALAKLAMEKLNQQYPSSSEAMNRELCQLLVYLEAPGVVEKTLALLDKAKTQEEETCYIFHLRNLRNGWTLEQRRKYFAWFNKDFSKLKHKPEIVRWFAEAGRDYTDGASFGKQLANIKKDAIANLSESEKVALADVTGEKVEAPVAAKPKERSFVKEWAMADLDSLLGNVSRGRDFEKGKNAYRDAQCLACHRFGNEGGSVGPELTAASSKYSRRDILDSIIAPSKVVSEQYQNETFVKKDGEDVTGRVVDENDQKVVLVLNPLAPDNKVELKKSDIEKRQPAKLSPMPEGLLNNLEKDEILDLLAYIESAGKAKAENFKK